MRRAVLAVLSCLMLIMTLSGCTTGSHEIDDLGYVFAIGIDKGVSDQYRFTFMMPTFSGARGQAGGGSDSGGSESSSEANQLYTTTIDSGTFYSAQTLFSAFLSRALNFSHAKYLVISEELARDNVEPFLNGMIRSSQIRRSMYILISRGTAADFIGSFKPVMGASVSKTMELLMMNGDKTELFNIITYNEFLDSMKKTGTQPAATLVAVNNFSAFKESGPQAEGFKSNGDYYAGEIPRSGGNRFEFCGTAVFNGPKMVGELTADETRAMTLLRGEFHTANIILPDPINPKLRLGVVIQQRTKPAIKVTFSSERPSIDVKVHIEGALQNVQSTEEYEFARKAELEKSIEKYVKEMLDRTIDKCQALNCEVFKFEDTAIRQFLTIQAWDDYGWISHFKDADVSTQVDFILRRTGTMTKTEGSHSA